MLFVMITKVQRRLRTFVRLLVVLLVLALLIPSLFTINERYAAVPKEERPTGQPLRVEEPQLLDQFVIKWKEWTEKKP
ncbi:hypothetical protein GJ688_09990 [Heliobacillus mobilis]|uniref:Uncharacterized protein n=1 Tax=Heliobacterium mobile TaxID=28064 RepID=A0A6I3SK45_HELMO|nr:hypothetical protein [Heliobacterium mobile]MTV49308.1 hypothetical protein [Heliobacterium mobile]